MKFWSKLRFLFRKEKLDAEMAEEMRLHVELQTERNVASGMTADEARWAARRMFGGVEQIKEECREQRGWVKLELFLKEIGFAARSLRRAPGFSLAVLATLALCIGPNTAILSALYTFVYKPLPFRDPQQLVSISNVAERMGGAKRPSSVAQSEDFTARADQFAGFGYFTATSGTLGNGEAADRAFGMFVSPNLLPLLGIPMELGRGFTESEQAPGKEHVVVLSQLGWERRFQRDPDAVGREIRIDDEPFTVVGVATRSFEDILNDVEFFRPYVRRPEDSNPSARYAATVRLIGRMKAGVTLETARAQLAALEQNFAEHVATPAMRANVRAGGLRIDVADARAELGDAVKTPLWLLQGGAALVLLLGCVNVASLLLARASTKRQELTIRRALGAGRGTLLRQMLAESVLLVGLAGAIGVGVAAGMLRFMNAYLPTVVRHVPPIAMETRVLEIVLGVVGVLVVAMAVAPFLSAGMSEVRLGETPRASTGRSGRAVIGVLVIGQVALALVLLVGAGLLLRSFARVMAVSPGFDADRVVQARVHLPVARYKTPQELLSVQQRIVGAIAAIPGVESVGVTADFPLKEKFGAVPFRERDRGESDGAGAAQVYVSSVSTGFFGTMGIRLRDGRVFRDDEDFRQTPVAVVDETFVRRFFPGRNVVGMEFAFGANPPTDGRPWIRIIGVVSRANLAGLEGRDGWPFVYLPFNQQAATAFSVVIRSPRLESDLAGEIRGRIHAIDPGLPFAGLGRLRENLDAMLGNRRALLVLLGLFGGLALGLAAVGLYGVLNYDVSQRTREIGIRGAIGATRGQIVALILRQGLGRAAAGLIVGGVGAALFARLLRKMLFDVSAADPVACGGMAALLLAVAVVASWLPARRAAKVDPIVALRCE